MGAGTTPGDPAGALGGAARPEAAGPPDKPRAGQPRAGEPQARASTADHARDTGGAAAANGAAERAQPDGAQPDGAVANGSAERAQPDGAVAEAAVPDTFPPVTLDTARPEGGGLAAASDAPAPARQWPLLAVLGTTGLGLAIVGMHPFADAFRVGTILIGVALIAGAVLRRLLPSVGMLAVRSRFTDMITYGVLGVVIVLLALMTQPRPWLEIPFLEDVVHSTVP